MDTTHSDTPFPFLALWLSSVCLPGLGEWRPAGAGAASASAWGFVAAGIGQGARLQATLGVSSLLFAFSVGELALAPALTLGGISLAELRLRAAGPSRHLPVVWQQDGQLPAGRSRGNLEPPLPLPFGRSPKRFPCLVVTPYTGTSGLQVPSSGGCDLPSRGCPLEDTVGRYQWAEQSPWVVTLAS